MCKTRFKFVKGVSSFYFLYCNIVEMFLFSFLLNIKAGKPIAKMGKAFSAKSDPSDYTSEVKHLKNKKKNKKKIK